MNKPLETAPRDATLFLAFCPKRAPSKRIVIGKIAYGGGVYTVPGDWHVEAARWMPLPEPPDA